MTQTERFDAIYREYRPKVSAYIAHRVSDPQDAQDLCSEVFRKALEHLEARPGEGVSSFLYTVTRNTVVDYCRRRRISVPLEEDLLQQDGPEAEVLSAETLDRLAQALRQLPEQERDIVVLHYYSGVSLTDIAGRMSLSYPAVKRSHQSALKKLRVLMGDQ